ncbi:MAG: hypothetical protein AAB527_01065 [Patescibacteria group bacterium]
MFNPEKETPKTESENKETESENKVPFSGELKMADFGKQTSRETIRELENRPDLLIRKDDLERFAKKERAPEVYKKGERLFAELREKYDIPVPRMQFVIGKDEAGRETLYTIIQKVEGENVEDILQARKNDPEFKNKLEDVYVNLTRYFGDKHKNGVNFLWDFHNAQFVYGKLESDKENNVYMVDVDPALNEAGYYNRIFINRISGMILDAEERLGVKFLKAREEFKKMFDSLSPQDRKDFLTSEILSLLKG